MAGTDSAEAVRDTSLAKQCLQKVCKRLWWWAEKPCRAHLTS